MNNRGLAAWMDKRRLKSPQKDAIVFGQGMTITYADLADTVDRVATLLRHRGITAGDRVAFLGENSPEFLEVLFAAARIGAVFVPVNTRLAPPEIAHVLRDSGARLLVHEPEFAERIELIAADAPPTLVTDAGEIDDPGLAVLARLTQPEVHDIAFAPDDPAAIVYTSGTTGTAKGAVLTHSNLTWVAVNTLVDYDVVSSEVALMISPLFHVAALGMGALPVILKGGTLILERSFDPGRALRLIERYGVTMLSGVPTTFQLLADHKDWAATNLSSLNKLTCGGSPVPTRVLNSYEERGLHFSQGYGMTETSPGATSLDPQMTRAKQGSVGLPHFFTDVRVADENGTPLPPYVVGEIQVSGPNVFGGYHGLPDSTAAAFTADGWFRSGDLGSVDDDGYLFVSDRLKDMIISGGENIYPAEVEDLISELDGVTGVAVIGIPNDRWGEVPWAVVTLRVGASLDLDGVRAHLEGRLARYKHPKQLIVLDDLPRTATGKVRKAELRSRVIASAT
ncbi:AMP-dependent synthetase [Leifsonia sp. Leaf336]|uniref:acyl-CoA synthetase n=1 Tax=Leifsonia sp. Leaf336 TaxID=1736341 RepID=UPI0006FFE743|nr:long-chain fatty acid--CoA ligase [Leifsonia sp. Leaf336]KQR53620.1 AMP-dependent synthetase [Leifsonia sp. Leaf336]